MSTVEISQIEENITSIRLNRPEKLNAMNAQLMKELFEAFGEVGRDNHCRVVILTGSGRGFCSGLDLDDSGLIDNVENLTIPRMSIRAVQHFSRVVPAMRVMPQPIICAINGIAYGGGFCLTLGADIRIASSAARFNSTGIVNGLTSTELGVSWILPRLIGASRANEIMLTGRVMEAPEALQIGLVSELCDNDQLLEKSLTVARRIRALSPLGVEMTKRLCWDNLEVSGLEAAIHYEDRNQLLLGYTTNLDEAKRARREKRRPIYRDQHVSWPESWNQQDSEQTNNKPPTE